MYPRHGLTLVKVVNPLLGFGQGVEISSVNLGTELVPPERILEVGGQSDVPMAVPDYSFLVIEDDDPFVVATLSVGVFVLCHSLTEYNPHRGCP